MDIRTTIAESAIRKKRTPWFVGGAVLAVVGIFFVLSIDERIDLNDRWSTRVQKGPLDVFVSGYGHLKSEEARLLSSPTPAIVDAITVKPGENVAVDTVIVRLLDPEVVNTVGRARLAWVGATSDLQALALKNRDEELALRSRILEIDAQYNGLVLEKRAIESLVAGVMSRVEFEKITIRVQLLASQLDFEKQRLDSIRQLHRESLVAKEALVKELERQLQSEQAKLDSLTVRPGLAGVLQELYVKVGESVPAGGKLALVGSADQLYAELTVPQRDAGRVAPGQAVTLNTFGGTASGAVSRIDPLVVDGRVTIDVRLDRPLPANARPELAIEGKVIVAQSRDALYIEAPPGIREGQTADLYAVDEKSEKARKTAVVFGLSSGRYIEIKSGAGEGQLLVMLDDLRLGKQDEVSVTLNGKPP